MNKTQQNCRSCHMGKTRCATCKGAAAYYTSINGKQVRTPCPSCYSTGYTRCLNCNGTGKKYY